MPHDSPAFELTPYQDPEPLPENLPLEHPDQLIGHEIMLTCDSPGGRFAYGDELVIVTKTRCWLVLRAEADQYGGDDDSAEIVTASNSSRRAKAEQLSDWLSARQMKDYGLASPSEYLALLALEQEREEDKKKRRADALRRQLAELDPSKP